MKNTITLLIFSLFVTTSFSQTPSFTVYYFNAERSNEGEIAAVYDDSVSYTHLRAHETS